MKAVPECCLAWLSLLMVIDLCQLLVTAFCMVSAASNPSFSSIPGCILTISVQPHLPLQKVKHLFPEHVVMTTDDVIPGVIDTNTQDGWSAIVVVIIKF